MLQYSHKLRNKANKGAHNMKRYKNRKSGIIVNVIGQNDAENKITVEFEDGKNAGKQVNYKLASFTKS